MLTGKYLSFFQQALVFIPESRLIVDEFRTLTYSTDASFYRLVPKLIVIADNEQEVDALMQLACELELPICFRAAGTSLSGQALSDSILIKLSENWKSYEVLSSGQQIKMGPMVLGSEANQALAPYNRMLAPMPASIDSATVGGMAINNAAGMNSLDTYGMMASAKFVFLNGAKLDTACEVSRQAFRARHPEIVEGIQALSTKLRANKTLSERVRRKFQIKNTTGYGLRALLDFDDAIDMLAHLMIGSEGTLGFISEISHNTIPVHKYKASAFLIFANIEIAGQAVMRFKQAQTPVSAAELIDYRSLQAVADKPGVPSYLSSLPEQAVALLVQVESDSEPELAHKVTLVSQAISDRQLVREPEFSTDPDVVRAYWQVRKGIFPAVGARRPPGTTTLIEDVAFPIESLSYALLDLQSLMQIHGYADGVIYGHAQDGNLHFIFSQSFETDADIQRYRDFMEDVCHLVVDKYDGSLKAEHGTGRNMAPFVRLEWGDEAYQLMCELKQILDPKGLLNPDVMLTQDADLFVKNIKPMPRVDPLIDKCIECGFCERLCPSKNLTLTPRQRIVGKRALTQLSTKEVGSDTSFYMQYEYQGIDTCAGCGLCSTVCPVGINTGDLIRQARAERNKKHEKQAQWAASYFAGMTRGVKAALGLANGLHSLVGTKAMQRLMDGGRALTGNRIGKWTPAMPTSLPSISMSKQLQHQVESDLKVVYLPSCVSRTMGPAREAKEQASLFDVTLSLLNKAGYQVILPEGLEALCCGMPFESKGHFPQAEQKARQTLEALVQASQRGRYPIYSDTSPCSGRLLELNDKKLPVYDSVDFIHEFLLERLAFKAQHRKLACHVTCSARRLGQEGKIHDIMALCSTNPVFPRGITCCGFAGDKGFTTPELNESALSELKVQVSECEAGFSTSRTCEIGLSHHSGIEYNSLVHLVNASSSRKAKT